ncbi:dihydrolipoyllysine-residue acetyltransferase [Pseudomonas fluorescens]
MEVSNFFEIAVPNIGDYKQVSVIEVLVKVGDSVVINDSLIVLETDKAAMEVPASISGKIKELKVKVGDQVSEGSLILVLEAGSSGDSKVVAQAAQEIVAPALIEAAVSPVLSTPNAEAPAPRLPTASYGDKHDYSQAHASPSVRKFARSLGVDLIQIKGTGPRDRIRKEDIEQYVKTKLAAGSTPAGTASGIGGVDLLAWPKVDFEKFGPIERSPLSRLKKISGANLHRNWVMIPHVTNNDEVDVTTLEELRVQLNKENEKSGVKVTMLAFMLKAVAVALRKFPTFNASLEGEQLVLKGYCHLGFAADTPNGLVVPVVRDADQKGVVQIAKEMGELAALARESKLKSEHMQGGCFTISSLGGIGGTTFTPIINAPEVAILGAGRAYMKPHWNGKEFEPRLTMPLSLSWDHRVIDGAEAARFLTFFGKLLSDFRRVAI